MLAPTGVGVLYGKQEVLEMLRPVRTGGGMVDQVTRERTTFDRLPQRLEAGTPNISGIIALGSAMDYLTQKGPEMIRSYEADLLSHAETELAGIEGLRILGHPARRAGAVSFTVDGVHPFDIAAILDKMGYAVRSGNHCAQPALQSLGADKAVRLSPAFYNTPEEIERFCDALRKVLQLLW